MDIFNSFKEVHTQKRNLVMNYYPKIAILIAIALTCFAGAGVLQAGIAPTALEANLGIFPIDIYTTPQVVDIFPGASCHTTYFTTPESCIQQFLASYAAQGVTSVRFLFGLGDGQWTVDSPPSQTFHSSYSTPFTATGGLNSSWAANLNAFFADLKAAGISNVVPTAILSYYWSGWNGSFQSTQTVNYLSNPGCPSGSETLVFFPWLPFGLTPNSNPVVQYPADGGDNEAYNCSPANPSFWGWTPYFNLVNEIISTAQANGIRISEYETDMEENLSWFTVAGRLFYDNITSTPVLATVNSALSSSFGNVGTTSTSAINPTSAAYDCGSVYGDSAHLLYTSTLLAAIGGAAIGYPSGPTPTDGLTCGGSTSGMITIPSSGVVPTVTDNHVYPCVEDLPGPACDTSTNATSTAQNIYDDIYLFLYYRGLLGNKAVMGETSSNNSSPSYGCDGLTPTLATENVSGYEASSLFSSDAASTVLRPWGWMTSVSPFLCQTPGNIGAPSGPYTR